MRTLTHGLQRRLRAGHISVSDRPELERVKILGEFVRSALAPRNGQASVLEARIREYEVRFEMTSAELHQGLRDGTQRETAEIAKWLFLLDARDDTGGVTA